MNILYVSVHSVLEFDEITMFKGMGHTVFPLGVNFGFSAAEPFRRGLTFDEREHALLARFDQEDCAYQYGPYHADHTRLTPAFVDLFDVVIVMHDISFIERFWTVLSRRPVIWRTIGQSIEHGEIVAERLVEAGLRVVRYSPIERLADRYCGEDALIRFGKDPTVYGGWRGDEEIVLSFANAFEQRYPVDADWYRQIVSDFPAALGGEHNAAMPGHIGLLTQEDQRERYRSARVYLYCSGNTIPYTLNLIEAMMTGIPVVAVCPSPGDKFFEVPAILAGGAGVLVGSVEEARGAIGAALCDHRHAAAIGAAGRRRAIELFGIEAITRQWQTLLALLN